MLSMILMCAAFGLAFTYPAPRLDLYDASLERRRGRRSDWPSHAPGSRAYDWQRLTYLMV